MFQSFSNSWRLIKASASVLSADKELFIFPIISALGTLVVTLTFALPMFFSGVFDAIATNNSGILPYLLGFLFYLAQYIIIFFANTALVGAALIRLRGGDPTVSDGFRIAFSHLGSIFGYALISATVGMIIRTLSSKQNGLGRIVISLIGMAWNIATFLVVPILATEDIGPIQAIKRSVNLLKKTWGEQLAGNFGLGAVFGLLTFGVILLGILGIFLAVSIQSVALVVAFVIFMVLVSIILGLVNSALSGIYTAAVYQFAVEGKTSGFFEAGMVQNAFRSR
jgi:Family of unknown function (DUF6159)